MKVTQLRTRKSIYNNRSYQSKKPSYHDMYIFSYLVIALVFSYFSIAPIFGSILFIIDLLWVQHGRHSSDMPTLYCISCGIAATLAYSSQYHQYSSAYHFVCLSRCIAPLAIVFRNKKQYEWLYATSWSVLKIVLSFVILLSYWNQAANIYSDWVLSHGVIPIHNPWTNPPAFILLFIACLNTIIDMIQSYFVLVDLKSFI